MKVSTQDGRTKRWEKPETIARIVWFKGTTWGYAHRAKPVNGSTAIASISKAEAAGLKGRAWVRVTEHEVPVPVIDEVTPSTGG